MKMLFFVPLISLAFLTSCGINQNPVDSGRERVAHAANHEGVGAAGHIEVDQILATSKFERVEDDDLIKRDEVECKAWNYDQSMIGVDAVGMKILPEEEWARRCYQYACSYKGEIEMTGKLYVAEVNAGGWIRIVSDNSSSMHYLATTASSDAFLAWCNCCE